MPNQNTFTITRRIGSTNYTVTAFASDTATEKYEEKLLRLIRNEVLDFGVKRDIIGIPQTSRQSERSA